MTIAYTTRLPHDVQDRTHEQDATHFGKGPRPATSRPTTSRPAISARSNPTNPVILAPSRVRHANAALPDLDEPLTLSEASHVHPERPARGALYRWITVGIRINARRVYLRATLGRDMKTTRRWVEEFVAACSAPHAACAAERTSP